MVVPTGYEKAVAHLAQELRQSEIPFNGWSFRRPRPGERAHLTTAEDGPTIVEIIHAETTAQQRQVLDEIVAGFEFEERTKKPRTDLRSALRSLSDADFKGLLVEVLAEKLEQDSEFAKRLGKAIDGDEAKRKLGGK
jgi:hypothetical protein